MADVSFTHDRTASASDYLALLKPRVMSLVVFTGLVGYIAAPGQGDFVLALRRSFRSRWRLARPARSTCGSIAISTP